MSNCFFHLDKPAIHSCADCGKNICRICTFEEITGRSVLRTTSIDREVQIEYSFFCPECFKRYAEEKGYNKGPRGALTRFKPDTLLFVLLWIFFALGFIFNFLFFGIGFIMWGVAIIAMIFMKYNAIKNFNRYNDALNILGKDIKSSGVHQTKDSYITSKIISPQPESVGLISNKSEKIKSPPPKYCTNCGNPIDEASKFCKNCGKKIE
ncbi:MAG: zinc-ribbon domain-containing protein [Promethearchaeota archaeon]